jgi:hypothetical protein
MKKLKNLIVSFELRNPVAALIFLAIYAPSGRFANGPKTPFSTIKLASLSVLLLLLPALLVSGPGVARGQDGASFTGTWLDNSKRIVYTISGEGGSLSGSYQYDLAGTFHANAKGNGSFSNCRTENDLVVCDWTGFHEDDHKTLSRGE